MLERVFYILKDSCYVLPPRPERSHFFTSMEKFDFELKRSFRRIPIMTVDSFLSSYVGKQKTVYSNAVKSLLIKPVEASDAKVSCFVKVEKINFSDKPDPAPRVICPRNPRYHVSIGPTIKSIEKEMYKRIDLVFKSPTVFKGMNAYTRGKNLRAKWERFNSPIAVGLDASRFDQHISQVALEWEHTHYVPYDNTCKFKWLLKQQLTNHCTYRGRDGKFSYTTSGTRCSGDMNTSLGNVLIMCALIYSYMNFIHVDKYELANDGDDCVLIIEKDDEDRFHSQVISWFEAMGITMKVEPSVDVFERVDFCQSRPVWTSDGYIMVLNPRSGLAKQCLSIKPLDSEKLLKRWLATTGVGGMSLAGQIPIWQEFYQHNIRGSEGAKIITGDPTQSSGFIFLCKGMKRQYGMIHPRTRYSFHLAYGISPSEQIAIEERCRAAPLTRFTRNIINKVDIESQHVW